MQQAGGTLYVLDKVQTGTMTVKFKDAAAAAEIRQSKSKVKLSLKKDGGVKAEIQVRQTVGIGDQKGTLNIANAENIPVLLKESEKTVKEEIMAAIDKAKELGADVFGFGKSIYRKYPRKWKEIEENWEEVFREMETVVKVKSKADGSGRIMRPIAPAVQ